MSVHGTTAPVISQNNGSHLASSKGTAEAGLAELLSRDRRPVAKGTVLTFEGDESLVRYHVVDGWLAASKSLEDGQQQILEFIMPGETCDPTSADNRTSFVQIEALCDGAVIPIDRTTWVRLLQSSPNLRHAERLRDTAAHAQQSERTLRLGKASAETRIAYMLIELCMRLTAIGATQGRAFHVPLSQQQLGDFAGLSAVHVCRTLRRLNRKGIITTGDHMDIVIHDLDALAELAGVDLCALRSQIIPGSG